MNMKTLVNRFFGTFVLCSLFFVLCPLSLGTLFAATPILSMPMEMDEDGLVKETVKKKSFSVRGKHSDSVIGVTGNAVRFDSYSSYIQIPMTNYQMNNKNVSISFWTICQTYPMMVVDVAGNEEAAALVRSKIPQSAAGEANQKLEELKQENEELQVIEDLNDALRLINAMRGGN